MTKRGRKKRKRTASKRAAIRTRMYRPYVAPEPAHIEPFRDKQLISELHAAAELYLDSTGVTLERTDRPNAEQSIVFGRPKTPPLVYVFRDEAISVRGERRRINGNFCGPGEHWAELHALLLDLQGGSQEEIPELPEMRNILSSLPSSLPVDLESAALQASARIRADMRVFPCPVILIDGSTGTQIRFEPIRLRPRRLVPFTVREASGVTIDAALDLTSTAGPIAVAFRDPADEARVTDVWLMALLAFADLIGADATTVNKEPRTRTRARRGGARLAGLPASDKLRPIPRRADTRGHRPVGSSGALTPIGDTASYRGSFVVGHRRRLSPGKSCGELAREAARLYGIELAAGWTWVQPHKRGLPDGVVLRYAWQRPQQLRAIAASGA